MKNKFKKITVLLLFLIAFNSFGQTEREFNFKLEIEFTDEMGDSETLEQKLDLASSSIWPIETFIAMLKLNITRPNNINESDYDKHKDEMLDEYFERIMQLLSMFYGEMLSDYLANYSVEELNELIAFYETDLGAKLKETHFEAVKLAIGFGEKSQIIREEIYRDTFGKKYLKK